MSLYNDASLVMIPSAYKDGKLYSIKPTDGSGDFTFSRGSNLAATRVDENGLIEKGRENLLLQSNQFDNGWFNVSSTETSGQSGYDGSSDAWLLEATASGGRLGRSISIASGVYTSSIYAKAGSVDYLILKVEGSSTSSIWYDLANGVVGTKQGSRIDTNIQSVGNGWYRCSVTTNQSFTFFIVSPALTNGETTSSNGDNIYIQDAQLEVGLAATDYIETTSTTAQAGILEDMPRLDYSGSCPSLLLEPQRTNELPHSEYFDSWTKFNSSVEVNATISPDGYANANKLIPNTTASSHQINYSISGSAHTTSVFAKAGEYSTLALFYTVHDGRAVFNLSSGTITETSGTVTASIEDFGNGWYRCILSTTLTTHDYIRIYAINGTTWADFSVAGDGSSGIYIYGAMLESGSYPTSYIPCYGAATTRSAEVCSQSFADITTYTQATFFSEFTLDPSNLKNSMIFTIGQSTSAGLLYLLINDTGRISYEYYLNSTLINNGNTTVTFNDGTNKVAFKMSYEGIKLYLNGVVIRSVTPNMPSGNYFNNSNIYIARYYSASFHFVDPYNQFAIFPTALTDSECIALTTI